MPYIKQDERDILDENVWVGHSITGPGELNYVITDLINGYLEDTGVSYSALNEVIGVLECAKLELYRRVAAPYEDKKKKENGDVYSVVQE